MGEIYYEKFLFVVSRALNQLKIFFVIVEIS